MNCDYYIVVLFCVKLSLLSVSLVGSTLQEQRHNLALELLWVQQAIHSRKQVCWLWLCSRKLFRFDYHSMHTQVSELAVIKNKLCTLNKTKLMQKAQAVICTVFL